MARYDAVIIGSGPAGLEAAINLKIRGKDFLLFGSDNLSKKVEAAPRVDNYLGLPGITGKELKERFAAHLNEMGIEVIHEQAGTVYPMDGYFAIATNKRTCEAVTVILATGVFSAKELPGEKEFLGRGVGYCATCDAPLYRDKTVAIIGYSKDSAEEANFISSLAQKVYFIPQVKYEQKLEKKIEIINGKVTRINGALKAQTLVLSDRVIEADGFFILRDTIAPQTLLPGLETENGFIKVDGGMQTNIPGCYAAGDCTGKPHQYMRAAGQGQTAALHAVMYIDKIKDNIGKEVKK